jgi:hypothetical protein
MGTLTKEILTTDWDELSKEIAEYEYPLLLKSGMFFNFFPDLSGDWDKDKEEFIKFIEFRERWKKENT